MTSDSRQFSLPPDLVRHSVTDQEHWPGSWDIDRWLPKLQAAWNAGVTGKGVRVCVLDTGVDEGHSHIPTAVARRSFVGGNSGDRNGHGTWCAGRILGRDGPGIAPDADLIVAKVLDDNGGGSSRGINDGVRWAAGEGADILSASLGGGSPSQADVDAIRNAYLRGVQCAIASAGNSGYQGRNTIGYPARYLDWWCNGATRRDGQIATFSSGGREIDDATPGEQVVSTAPGNRWSTMSGTSMSCPFRAGLQSLIIHRRRMVGMQDLIGADAWREFFEQEGFYEDRGEPGKDVRFGLGSPLIDKILDWVVDPKWL